MKFWGGNAFLPTTDLPVIARLLDECGYHGLMISDHIAYPRSLDSEYPYGEGGGPQWPAETEWPHPWVLASALAATTTRLHFNNSVYLAPARPLLEVVKQIATASVLSGGRVGVGVAAGWMREEFALMGEDFGTRGRRLDEMIQAMRALWAGGWVSYRGEYYDVPEVMIEPHPPAPVPIWCGGLSEAALRRAARHCDGWIGISFTWDDAAAYVGRLRKLLAECGRTDDPFEIIVSFREPVTVDLCRRAADELGITGVMYAPWMASRDRDADPEERYRAPIERFAEDVVSRCP